MNSTRTLTSLAILKVDLDQQNRDYVDYLSPFAIDVLKIDPPDVISDVRVADKLLERFGLKIPTKAVQHVLRRLQRKRYLTNDHGAFVCTPALPDSTLSHTRAAANTHIENVIKALIGEAKQHNVDWTEADATRAVTSFLSNFTVDCLRTYVFNTALPAIPKSKSAEQYIIGRFLRAAQERNDHAFESFIVLVKGSMYSNALLCPDLESLEKKFQDVTFYLDTPLVLNLLGLQGADAKRSADELISLLGRLKGSVAVFAHTVNECQQVLAAAAANFDNPRATGRVIEEARRNGTQLTDLIIARDSVDEKLRRLGVYSKKTPEYEGDFQVDEREFEEALAEEVYYKGEAALLNDINSIRSIYVLRRGKQPLRLEDSGAVFVTTNGGFAKVAFHIGRNHNSTREVSSVITAYSLANIAWLKSPMQAPSLPETETMALCYAALEPSPELFRKYVQEMDKLLHAGEITARDHEILRLSPAARDELMELTLGDEHALTANSLKSILANVKAVIIAEQQQAHEVSLSELSEQNQQQLSELQQRELALHQRLAAAEADAAAARNVVSDLQSSAASARQRRTRIYQIVARVITTAVMIGVIVVLVVGALAGSGLISAASDAPTWWRYGLPVLVLCAVLWGVYSWHTGATVRAVARSFEERFSRRLQRWIEGEA